MSILTMPKSFDEIEEATTIEEGWYPLKLVKEPEKAANRVLKNFIKDRNLPQSTDIDEALAAAVSEGYHEVNDDREVFPGINWVLKLRIQNDDPGIHGRAFTKYLPLPGPQDEGKVTPLGQPMIDSKMAAIQTHVLALGGECSGERIDLPPGGIAEFYIEEAVGQFGASAGKPINQLGMIDPRVPGETDEVAF
jgi:hypothetical protein